MILAQALETGASTGAMNFLMALMIGVGGLTTSFDRRYRRVRRSQQLQGVEGAAA